VFRLVLARTKRRWVDHIFIRVMSGFVARAEVSMAQAALCAVRSRAFWPSSLYSRIAQQTLHGIQVRCRGRRCSGFRRAAQRSSSSHSRPLPLMPCPPCSPLQFLHLPSRNPPPRVSATHVPQAAAAARIVGQPDILAAARNGNLSLVKDHVLADETSVNKKDEL
jgi:hypothetical protein